MVKPHPPQDVAAEKRKRLALEKLRQLEERLKQQIAESAYLSKKLEDGSIDAATATTWAAAVKLRGHAQLVEQVILPMAERVAAILHAKFGCEEHWPEDHREMVKRHREAHRAYLKAVEEQKSLPKPSMAYVDFAAQEAQQGNPALLVSLLPSGIPLGPAAVEVITAALTAKPGPRPKP